MSFKAIRENKIISKISEFTVDADFIEGEYIQSRMGFMK